jgi:hypothetical protein
VVGTAQWLVLKGPLPTMRWGMWALATGAGAFLAWTLGMIPSTLLSLGSGGGAPSAEPAEATVLGLAFLMGLVLGPVLGLAQWLALRRFMRHAALWMPANALAWQSGWLPSSPEWTSRSDTRSDAAAVRGDGRGDTRPRARLALAPGPSPGPRKRLLVAEIVILPLAPLSPGRAARADGAVCR